LLGERIGKPASGEVLECKTDAAEHGHVRVRAAARLKSRQNLAKFRVNGLRPKPCAADCPHLHRKLTVVHHDARRPQRVGCNFTLAGLVRPKRGHVQAKT